MLVSREEFMESISYLEIDNEQLVEFAHSSLNNLHPSYFKKRIKPEIFAVFDPKRELFAIQPYNQVSLEHITKSEDFQVLPFKELIQPFLH